MECSHGLPAPIVAEDEFIKINLKLIAAHAVIGSDQPLLEIPNGAVCQRQYRVRAFAQIDSQGLRARHMLKSGFLQSRKGLETVGVYSRAPDIVAGLPSPHADTATSGLTRLSRLISMALDYPKPNDPFMFSLRYT